MRARILGCMLLCLCCAARGEAQQLVSAAIVDYGVYSAALDENTGQAARVKLLRRTQAVPATPGTIFGISYQVEAPQEVAEVRVQLRVEHPPVTDPETGVQVDHYSVEKVVTPGRTYVQVQRVPQAAPQGEYRFVLLFQGETLAFQSFTLEGRSSGFALLGEPLRRHCRDMDPSLFETDFTNPVVLEEHTFALALGNQPPTSDTVCFLALAGENGTGLVLSDMGGAPLAVIQEPERGLHILAVSFLDVAGNGRPDIVVVAENGAQEPPVADSRVYLSEKRGLGWIRDPELDKQVAHMGGAFAIKRWLARTPSLPERGHGEPVDAEKDRAHENNPEQQHDGAQ